MKAGAGTSCPMSTMALTMAMNASRPSAIASSSVAPSATTPGMSGIVNIKPPPSAEVKPAFPFEAYSHGVGPIDAAGGGGGFMFTMPDIPSVVADGATALEAVADGRAAFVAMVSAMVDMGQEVPAPAFKVFDFTPASASGKVLARLPRSMHLQLTARAKTEGVSLTALVLAFIAEGLGRRNAGRV